MRRIVFHSNQISVRGSEVALYDYAKYNESILGNESIIVYGRARPDNDAGVIEKFKKSFPVHDYGDFSEVDELIRRTRADLLYCIKGGWPDGKISQLVPTMVHAVFPTKPREFHGSAFAFVSAWLAKTSSNNRAPAVPHIVKLPDINGDLRGELNLPKSATVFGCHGGNDSFDIRFVKNSIPAILSARDDVHFLFLNITPFITHPRVRFLPGTADMKYKVRFINSCDAMLHARALGESFGLACGEFSVRNKPVLTYAKSVQRNHIEVLGKKALLYDGPKSLKKLLLEFSKTEMAQKDWDCYSKLFSPENVMRQFDEHFIQHALRRGIAETSEIQLDWADKLACKAQAATLRWTKISRLWASGAYKRP